MAKRTHSMEALPPAARSALVKLGRDLRLARERRGWSLRDAAGRLFVTVPTLQRLEAGHPGVSLGILTHALFVFGMSDRLAWLADPRFDMQSLAADARRHLRGSVSEDDFDV